jgi:hypothetical protein
MQPAAAPGSGKRTEPDPGLYECPVYATTARGDVAFFALLKTRAPPAKWALAAVALLMDTY